MHKLDILDNGLKVATKSMEHMESVAIGIWLRAGGRYENPSNSGISHLLEHLLFKGTTKRDMITIKQEIEGRGGSFNGFTSEEHTCYLVKVLSKDIELGIDILSDMVRNPKLAEEEIQKEKSVIVEEINMYKDIPAHHVHEILAEVMWPGIPLGMPLAGTEGSVRAMTKDAIASYKEERYSPANMLLIAAGKVDESSLLNKAKKYLGDLAPKKTSGFEKAKISQDSPKCSINFKETEQTHIALGLHSLDRFSHDKHILSMLNIILGANMSSRLFHTVRDEMALCYEISSGVRKYEDCGAFVVSAGLDVKNLKKALEVVLRELSRIKKEPVSAGELNRAKEYYKGQLLFALEDTMSHMLWLGEKVISGEKDFAIKNILENIDKVKAEDIMRVASGIFVDKNLSLAAIGPVKDDGTIKDMLHLR